METCEIFTLAVPLLVMVTVRDCLVPTTTLPKSSLAGESPNWPPLSVPSPERTRFGTAFRALLVTLAVALKVPAPVGANFTVTDTLWPAGTVTGRLGETSEKYLLEIAALLMMTGWVSELVAVTMRVLPVPAGTVPKFRLAVLKARSPVCCC